MAFYYFSDKAEDDLYDIWLYRSQQGGPDKADALLDTIQATCQTLADSPDIGTSRDYTPPGVLAFPKNDYMIFYQKAGDDIQIIRVFHGRQDIENLL
jgi:toxin ParE1/3/4